MSFFRQFNMNDIEQSILDQIEKCLKNKTIHTFRAKKIKD